MFSVLAHERRQALLKIARQELPGEYLHKPSPVKDA
jgi:hypothetical protein